MEKPPLAVENTVTVANIKQGDSQAVLLLLRFTTAPYIGGPQTQTQEIALSIQSAESLAQELLKRTLQARQIAQAEGIDPD